MTNWHLSSSVEYRFQGQIPSHCEEKTYIIFYSKNLKAKRLVNVALAPLLLEPNELVE